jgi:hypothetical protein
MSPNKSRHERIRQRAQLVRSVGGVKLRAERPPTGGPGLGFDRSSDDVAAEQEHGLSAQITSLGVAAVWEGHDRTSGEVEAGLNGRPSSLTRSGPGSYSKTSPTGNARSLISQSGPRRLVLVAERGY